MPILTQTEAVFAEIAANRTLDFGSHGGDELRNGGSGQAIAEVPFDPTIHSPIDIDPFSLMGGVTDTLYVRQTVPKRPLSVNIITQHDAAQDDPLFSRVKYALAAELKASIRDSVPGVTDRVYSYHIGNVTPADIDQETDFIETNGDASLVSRSIAELCRDGLAFVISDFRGLQLDKVPNANYPATVAVKVNHPGEIAFPAHVGRISVGGRGEVNTNNSKQLRQWNDRLALNNQSIIDGLQRVGIQVASVIFDTAYQHGLGFDVSVADSEIAKALYETMPY